MSSEAPRVRATAWDLRSDGAVVLASLAVALVAALGVAAAWLVLAPRPTYVIVDGGVAVDSATNGAYVAADGRLGVACAVAGIVCAALLWRRGRDRPVGLVVGLVLGGLLGAALAWQLGQAVAADDVTALARDRAVGERFEGGLDLRARGVLLAWPIAASVIVFSLLAGADPGDDHGRRLVRRGRAPRP